MQAKHLNLKERYARKVVPALMKEKGLKSPMAVGSIVKVVINTGVGKFKDNEKTLQDISAAIFLVTGQKALLTQAKKAIAGFKLRKGEVVGYKVSLRGAYMYDFLDRLLDIVLPRTKDFRGILPTSIDQNGNLTVGIKESIAFPEISGDEIKTIFGFEVTVVTDIKDRNEAINFFKTLGFPIREGS